MRKFAWLFFGTLALAGAALADADNDFKTLDTNRDGYISLDEAKEEPLLARNFYQFDTQKTGQVDEAEFAAYDEMDKDKLEPYVLRHEWYGDAPGTEGYN